MPTDGLVDLGDANTSFVVDPATGGGVVLHWGASLGGGDLASIATALSMVPTNGSVDVVAPIAFVPEHGSGFPGRPGLSGHRTDGTAWSPRFVVTDRTTTDAALRIESTDATAGLRLVTAVTRVEGGAISIALTLTNDGPEDYWLDDLAVTLAVPPHANELLTFHGRWCREFHPVRRPLGPDAYVAENRRGRTSHENPPYVWAGTTGFGEQRGEVWGAHLAWSGNSRVSAQRLPDGRVFLQLGELLHPGELTLGPGESYRTPDVYAVYSGAGLTPASRRYHAVVRAMHGARDPRPVVLNTWEAVYFDHDDATLLALAERAAAVGVERFVLDDGWFGSRRDDTSGLGDWWVSPDAHPRGLAPLIARVRELGMQFGIWVEPEMVNPDSELYRAHPDWTLSTDGYDAVLGRHQLVLDIANPAAYDEILGRLDTLLGDHDIAFVKWDMNRDHIQGSGADGRAGTHAQTLALYRMLDELRSRHAHVEFESCSSGGARIDLGILGRTDRVWTSDCNDALERQVIQYHASMLLPPDVIGAHVGPARAHTTGRTQPLAFRAGTALFGHFGIEWNLLTADDDDLAALAGWVDLYKSRRALLHGGDVLRIDHDDPHALVHGVLATDRAAALIAYVQLSTAQQLLPRPVRVPDLDPDTRYDVGLLALPGSGGRSLTRSAMPVERGVVLTGRQLAVHGVRLPAMMPESLVLVTIEAQR